MPNVYTPKTLASAWQCSEKHVRNLIDRGELRAFYLGGKLLRIRPVDVEEFENRNLTELIVCPTDDVPPSTKTPIDDDFRLLRIRRSIQRQGGI